MGERGAGSKVVTVLLLFLILGAVLMKIASKRFFVFKGAGHLKVCLARDGVTGGRNK